MSALRICSTKTLLVAAVSTMILAATTGVSYASNVVANAKYNVTICPDGNPCPASPAIPVGTIDCTPTPGRTLPASCTLAIGEGDKAGFNIANLPSVNVVVGAARSVTTFDMSAISGAMGQYSSMALFYVDFGDGTGYGSAGNLRTLTSFPSSHIYVEAGNYTITGYGSYKGRTDSTTMNITVPSAKNPDPTPDKVASTTWAATTDTVTDTVEATGSATSVGTVQIGVGGKVITGATSKSPATTAAKAPKVKVKPSNVIILLIPKLPPNMAVLAEVNVNNTWYEIPAADVTDGGTLTLSALTFVQPGSYSVRLTLASGAKRFVTITVKR
jgi:hypothetical protein